MNRPIRLFHPVWKTADGKRHKSARLWLDFYDADHHRRRLPGLVSRRHTETLARNVERLLGVRQSGDTLPADLLKWLESVPGDFRRRLAEAGLIDRERAGGMAALMMLGADGKVIGGHLADFLADAEARGVLPIQLTILGQRIRDVLTRCGAKWLRDLSAASVQAAIAALATPTKDRPKGLSQTSLDHYARAVRQFSKWLQRERRTAEHTLVGVKGYNCEIDKRHERRGFSAEEMAALLDYMRQAPTRWGMTAPARAAAYWLAFSSGLRRNEIRTLTRASFRLDADPPTVTVEAGYSKHRRQDVQPLPGDAAEMLAGYLADADPARPFKLPDKTSDMLYEDMGGARDNWLKESDTAEECYDRVGADFLLPRDSRGLVLDFHSFRHGYVSAICRANVSPRVMMELARHSDPKLTMKRYSRVAVSDTAAALDALPKLATRPDDRQEQRATGTYNVTATLTGATGRSTIEDRRQGRLSVPSDQRPALDAPKTPSNHFAAPFAENCILASPSVDHRSRNYENADSEITLDSRGEPAIIGVKAANVPVAQLDRVLASGAKGCGFNSHRAYIHKPLLFIGSPWGRYPRSAATAMILIPGIRNLPETPGSWQTTQNRTGWGSSSGDPADRISSRRHRPPKRAWDGCSRRSAV